MGLEGLDVLHGERAEPEAALGADVAVEEGPRHRQRHDGPPLAGLLHEGQASPGGAPRVGRRAQWGHGHVADRTGEEGGVGRRRTGPLDLVGDLGGIGVGSEVEQGRGQAGAGDPVEEAVVVLHQQRNPVVGQPFDEPGLPQRVAAIELAAQHPAGEQGQLLHPARRGDGHVVEVAVDVEVLVVDPDRTVEPEGHLVELPGELRRQREPGGEDLPHLQEVEVGRVAPVEDREPADVLVPVGLLHGEEQRVGAAEALHRAGAASTTCAAHR